MAQLTKAQFDALQAFAAKNGRLWKSKLIQAWMNGTCEGELQQVRNAYGARWLLKFRFAAYHGVVWPT